MWISKQSSICRGGTRFGNSVDPVVSVQNKNFSGNTKELAKVPWSPIGILKTFTLTTPWNVAKLVEIFPGIIVRRHRTTETIGIAERPVRRVKEGTSAVLLQSGLNENRWADSTECQCCQRNIQDLLSDGKTLCERRFGVPFKGQIIPFGSVDETRETFDDSTFGSHAFEKQTNYEGSQKKKKNSAPQCFVNARTHASHEDNMCSDSAGGVEAV